MAQQQKKPDKPGNGQATESSQQPGFRTSRSWLLGSQYKIGDTIGKGNFGEVRLGKDVKNNEDVAVKTVGILSMIHFAF